MNAEPPVHQYGSGQRDLGLNPPCPMALLSILSSGESIQGFGDGILA
jgi:hypothetical protein